MPEKKKNVPLVIALSIPVLMILLIAVSIYLPVLFVKPGIDFIYSHGGDYCSRDKYSVRDEKIVENAVKENSKNHGCGYQGEVKLYYYDVQRDTAREITFEEAKNYQLDNHSKSLDGFEVVPGNQSFDILFFSGSSYYDKYLKKGAFSRKLNIGKAYYYSFKFIGWIKESSHEQG